MSATVVRQPCRAGKCGPLRGIDGQPHRAERSAHCRQQRVSDHPRRCRCFDAGPLPVCMRRAPRMPCRAGHGGAATQAIRHAVDLRQRAAQRGGGSGIRFHGVGSMARFCTGPSLESLYGRMHADPKFRPLWRSDQHRAGSISPCDRQRAQVRLASQPFAPGPLRFEVNP